jgi:UDP-galactopyranose mutase
METEILIVGCGLSGAVIAEQLANKYNKKVLIIDKRDHIGGNCYDYIDEKTNIRVNKYGAHLFHTNDEGVWEYINNFSKWIRYEHKVVANIDNRNVSVPVNMETINIICNEHLQTIEETKEWLEKNQIKFENPQNSEEIALSRVGKKLYEKLFLPYTLKQWNKHPKELDSSVLSRIPVKYNNDTRYFTDKYQVIPEKGYTSFFESLLSNPNIKVLLNTSFNDINIKYEQLIFTGPIDSYFKDSGLESLEYRSLRFEEEIILNKGFAQQHMVINTPSSDIPMTRIIEYKHLPYSENINTPHTIIIKEYPSDFGEPYYPVPNDKNQKLYNQYKKLAESIENKNVHMIGRLANYKYFNMDQAIRNALDYIPNIIKKNYLP